MSPVPDNVVNKALYQRIKDEIHARLAREGGRWSARASQELVNKYKQRGGTYTGSKPRGSVNPRGEGGLIQWQKEQWKDQHGRPCGSGKKGEVVKCRPSKRVNKSTPVTWKEMTPSQIKKAEKEKKEVGMGNRAPSIKKSPTKKSPTKKSPTKKSPTKRGSMKDGVKIGRYYYKKSTEKGKKLMTIVNGKTINFGDSSMQHYKDKTGIWSSKDHGDPKRRKRYLSRAKGIKLEDGSLAWKDPKSPNYHAVRILW